MPVRRAAIAALLLAALALGALAPTAGATPTAEQAGARTTAARHGSPKRSARKRAARKRAAAHAKASARPARPAAARPVRPAAPVLRPATLPARPPVTAPAVPPAAPVAPAPPAPTGPCADADTMPTAADVEAVRAAVSCLVNAERGRAGLAALADDPQLRAAAQGHSDDMVARLFFDHTSLDGRTVADRIFASGYVAPTSAYSMGENIAWGSGGYATPSEIVRMWMDSPGHRANILSARYRDAGVGIAIGVPSAPAGQGATYTQDFGAR